MSIIGDHLTEGNSGMYDNDENIVDLELTDEEFIALAKEAHMQDITFNQYIIRL